MTTIDVKLLVRKFASDNKLRNRPKKNYNMSDPMQRKQWWIDKVCYFCYLKHDKETAQALRIELTKPYVHPTARAMAKELWSDKKRFDEIITRRTNEYTEAKESYRQKLRNRRK